MQLVSNIELIHPYPIRIFVCRESSRNRIRIYFYLLSYRVIWKEKRYGEELARCFKNFDPNSNTRTSHRAIFDDVSLKTAKDATVLSIETSIKSH